MLTCLSLVFCSGLVIPAGAIQITDGNSHGIQTLTMSNSDPAVSTAAGTLDNIIS